jgi:hypothetical protein
LGKSFTESFGSGGGRKVRSPPEMEREEKTEKREEEERDTGQTCIQSRTSASMVPYCDTSASRRSVPFLSTLCDP